MAFTLRFKLISFLKEVRNNEKLQGTIELDEYYLSFNLKRNKNTKYTWRQEKKAKKRNW